jgi:hypothetical protein
LPLLLAHAVIRPAHKTNAKQRKDMVSVVLCIFKAAPRGDNRVYALTLEYSAFAKAIT